MAYQLSDNGLKAVIEIGRWVMAGIAVATLWVQSHNQHDDKIEVDRERVKALQGIEKHLGERKPLVFGKD